MFIDAVGPQTQILEKRRQVFEAQRLLEEKTEEFNSKIAELAHREEALRRKDLDLQDALLRINPLLEENQAKKVRAEKRAIEERRATEAKDAELREAQNSLMVAQEEIVELNAARLKLERYHNYFAVFQNANTEEFPEISSVIDRYQTLIRAHEDLLSEQNKLQYELDEARRNLSRAQKHRATQVLTSENIIGRLKDRLEFVKNQVSRLSVGEEEASITRATNKLELAHIFTSVMNLFNRCVKGPIGKILRHSTSDLQYLGEDMSELFEKNKKKLGTKGSAHQQTSEADLDIEESNDSNPSEDMARYLEAALGDSFSSMTDEMDSGSSARNKSSNDAPYTSGVDTSFKVLGYAGTTYSRYSSGGPPIFLAQGPKSSNPVLAGTLLGVPLSEQNAKDSIVDASRNLNGDNMFDMSNVGDVPVSVLKQRIKHSLELLSVVAYFVCDLEDVIAGYPAWLASQKHEGKDKGVSLQSGNSKFLALSRPIHTGIRSDKAVIDSAYFSTSSSINQSSLSKSSKSLAKSKSNVKPTSSTSALQPKSYSKNDTLSPSRISNSVSSTKFQGSLRSSSVPKNQIGHSLHNTAAWSTSTRQTGVASSYLGLGHRDREIGLNRVANILSRKGMRVYFTKGTNISSTIPTNVTRTGKRTNPRASSVSGYVTSSTRSSRSSSNCQLSRSQANTSNYSIDRSIGG